MLKLGTIILKLPRLLQFSLICLGAITAGCMWPTNQVVVVDKNVSANLPREVAVAYLKSYNKRVAQFVGPYTREFVYSEKAPTLFTDKGVMLYSRGEVPYEAAYFHARHAGGHYLVLITDKVEYESDGPLNHLTFKDYAEMVKTYTALISLGAKPHKN